MFHLIEVRLCVHKNAEREQLYLLFLELFLSITLIHAKLAIESLSESTHILSPYLLTIVVPPLYKLLNSPHQNSQGLPFSYAVVVFLVE